MKHDELWNKFINEICYSFIDNRNKSLSEEQKNAIIAFVYDAEVNHGGHITFFDCYGGVFSVDEVANALRITAGENFAANFLSAAAYIHYTEEFGYMPDKDLDTDPFEDDIYYKMIPALSDLLEEYICNNKEKIFL